MFVLGCMFLFYDCSVCFSVVWWGCEYVDVRFGADDSPSTSSLHLTTHHSIILLHQITSLHSTSTHPITSQHSFSTSLTHSLWSAIEEQYSVTLLFFFLCNWDNLRRQSHPHFHPFSSSATPHFNLQVLVFVFHSGKTRQKLISAQKKK